eukprot:6595360-Pyramimonas_sp.AAC.1
MELQLSVLRAAGHSTELVACSIACHACRHAVSRVGQRVIRRLQLRVALASQVYISLVRKQRQRARESPRCSTHPSRPTPLSEAAPKAEGCAAYWRIAPSLTLLPYQSTTATASRR